MSDQLQASCSLPRRACLRGGVHGGWAAGSGGPRWSWWKLFPAPVSRRRLLHQLSDLQLHSGRPRTPKTVSCCAASQIFRYIYECTKFLPEGICSPVIAAGVWDPNVWSRRGSAQLCRSEALAGCLVPPRYGLSRLNSCCRAKDWRPAFIPAGEPGGAAAARCEGWWSGVLVLAQILRALQHFLA